VALALVLLGPLALAVRDRWPLAALATTMLAADVYIGRGYAFGPIFVSVGAGLVYTVMRGLRRSTWVITAAGFAGFVVASLVDPVADGVGLVRLALVAGWLAVALAVSELIRVRRAQIVDRQRAEHEERQRRVSDERLRLAQELHDVLAHNISLINVQAGVALHLLGDQPEQARPALTNIKAASRDALRELRGALDVLRRGDAAPLLPAPRLDDIDALVEGVRPSGLDVRVERRGVAEPLPAGVELAAYRIVQEALTNVTRHAGATRATVSLRYGEGITVEVVDNGANPAPAAEESSGRGLAGMRERAAALGGTVECGPAESGGFRVLAHLPGGGR
jgi:signal transduction histidine kinase